MKNLIKYLFILALVPALVMTSCKEDSTDPDPEFDLLTAYMAQNNLDLSNVLDGWVTSGAGLTVDPVTFEVADYYIIDLRSTDDFNAGHIKDAHNATMANLLTEADKAGSSPILMVCYTGQTAARATGLLRMLGYNAKSLKWGMSAWHSNLAGKWESNATDYSSPNWVSTGTPPPYGEFEYPNFVTGMTDGAAILRARVEAMLTKSGWGVSKTDLLDNPNNYFINNKWPLASWDEYGHIDGAYRIDEDLNLNGLKYLDPSKPVVTYCYTGQTSAITGAWLDVVGYDSKSLLFGANGIVHSSMLNGSAGSAPAKSWKGAGSGSEMNYGYYDSNGNLIGPN